MIRSELDVLLEHVEDPALREDLRTQIDRLKQRRSFGLVFEQHIPERVRLPQHPIRIGSHVVSRDDDDSATFEVVAIEEVLRTVELVRDPDGAYVPRDCPARPAARRCSSAARVSVVAAAPAPSAFGNTAINRVCRSRP